MARPARKFTRWCGCPISAATQANELERTTRSLQRAHARLAAARAQIEVRLRHLCCGFACAFLCVLAARTCVHCHASCSDLASYHAALECRSCGRRTRRRRATPRRCRGRSRASRPPPQLWTARVRRRNHRMPVRRECKVFATWLARCGPLFGAAVEWVRSSKWQRLMWRAHVSVRLQNGRVSRRRLRSAPPLTTAARRPAPQPRSVAGPTAIRCPVPVEQQQQLPRRRGHDAGQQTGVSCSMTLRYHRMQQPLAGHVEVAQTSRCEAPAATCSSRRLHNHSWAPMVRCCQCTRTRTRDGHCARRRCHSSRPSRRFLRAVAAEAQRGAETS